MATEGRRGPGACRFDARRHAKDTADQRQAATAAAAIALAGALPRLAKAGHDILIIDTPPAADRIVALAIAAADLLLCRSAVP